jgi:predicted phosphodiesterase
MDKNDKVGDTSHGRQERIYEVITQYLIHGDETAELMGIKPQTLARYLRRAKALGVDIERGKVLRDIEKNYTRTELMAIAKGAKILPGQPKTPVVNLKGDRTRIGILGDIHFGSVYCDINYIYEAYKEFERVNVDFVCQVGDVCEGMSNRPGHIYELSHLGYTQQKEIAIEVLSKCPSPIYLIDGNHDRWFIKSNGAYIVPDICEAIEHATFLGHDEGDISLSDTATVKLWHGEDGSSYAVSYRIQKIVESLTGGTKPNVMMFGHVHKSMYLFDRHIHCYSAGCIQKQSGWMKSKRLSAHTGFWVIDVYVNKTGVAKTTGTWYPFYA